MKRFTFKLGTGEGRRMDAVGYSTTFDATDLHEAVSKAKELLKARAADPCEDTAHLFEGDDSSLFWTPSVAFLRR